MLFVIFQSKSLYLCRHITKYLRSGLGMVLDPTLRIQISPLFPLNRCLDSLYTVGLGYHFVILMFHNHKSLENNFTKRPIASGSRDTRDVYWNMVAHTAAITSVLASSHPVWRDQFAGNTLWVTARTSLATTDDRDTQAKYGATPQMISNKDYVKFAFSCNIRNRNLHPRSYCLRRSDTGCCVGIKNFRNLVVITYNEI